MCRRRSLRKKPPYSFGCYFSHHEIRGGCQSRAWIAGRVLSRFMDSQNQRAASSCITENQRRKLTFLPRSGTEGLVFLCSAGRVARGQDAGWPRCGVLKPGSWMLIEGMPGIRFGHAPGSWGGSDRSLRQNWWGENFGVINL
jgi:hypothetical protein